MSRPINLTDDQLERIRFDAWAEGYQAAQTDAVDEFMRQQSNPYGDEENDRD